MILPFLFIFLLPVVLSLLITPHIVRFAHWAGAIDLPDHRKVHTHAIPRFGGVAILLSFILSLGISSFVFPDLFSSVIQFTPQTLILSTSLLLVFFLGIWDDITPLKPGLKFGLQFLIATAIYAAGFKISTVMNPLGFEALNVQLIDYPLTIIWIIGITNAFNLIDGLDGLASGIATVCSLTIFVVSATSGDLWVALLALLFTGSLVGFLRYNFNPARIFLGDSGSLFIGFSLALLSIQTSTKISTGFSILFPIIVLGLPITDTIVSMLRRFLGTFLMTDSEAPGKQSMAKKMHLMFLPDKAHIHHQLMAQGLSHRNTVLALYFISTFFALSAFAIARINSYSEAITALTIVAVILIFGIKRLRYREINIFRNGIFLPFYEKFFINKSLFLNLLDFVSITLAYSITLYLIDWVNPNAITAELFRVSLGVIGAFQLLILWVSGLYRESLKSIGIGNIIQIIRMIVICTVASSVILALLMESFSPVILPFLVIDFYLLLTFILGIRISYHALNYLFKKHVTATKNILIYGANDTGILALQKILATDYKNIKVLGFIDENTELEGKSINGFPIFGGHWKLSRLFQKHRVDEILLCVDDLNPEVLRRLKYQCQEKEVPLQKFRTEIQTLDVESKPKHKSYQKSFPLVMPEYN